MTNKTEETLRNGIGFSEEIEERESLWWAIASSNWVLAGPSVATPADSTTSVVTKVLS